MSYQRVAYRYFVGQYGSDRLKEAGVSDRTLPEPDNSISSTQDTAWNDKGPVTQDPFDPGEFDDESLQQTKEGRATLSATIEQNNHSKPVELTFRISPDTTNIELHEVYHRKGPRTKEGVSDAPPEGSGLSDVMDWISKESHRKVIVPGTRDEDPYVSEPNQNHKVMITYDLTRQLTGSEFRE